MSKIKCLKYDGTCKSMLAIRKMMGVYDLTSHCSYNTRSDEVSEWSIKMTEDSRERRVAIGTYFVVTDGIIVEVLSKTQMFNKYEVSK